MFYTAEEYAPTESNCDTLDPAWKGVLTEPPLSVQHGAEISLSCSCDHVIKATCLYGKIVPTERLSLCCINGMLLTLFLAFRCLVFSMAGAFLSNN